MKRVNEWRPYPHTDPHWIYSEGERYRRRERAVMAVLVLWVLGVIAFAAYCILA
jgi:hypothetical protein